MPEARAVAVERSLQPRRFINQERCLFDVMFLAEFTKEHLSESLRLRRKQPHVEVLVGCWVDSSIQPVTMVIELDHNFVDRNVIRVLSVSRL